MIIHTKSKIAAAVMVATLGLTACGGSSSSPAPTPAPTPTPTNSAPTDIGLTNTSVSEREKGAAVGTLSATDANSGDTFTFTVDDDRFEVDGTTLKLKAETELDYDKGTAGDNAVTSVALKVTVKDKGGLSFTKDFTIDVTDVLDYYDFPSKNVEGKSSVSYGGQVGRHLLINDLKNLINTEFGTVSTFEAAVNAGKYANKQAVIDAMNNFFKVPDGVYESLTILTKTEPAAQQNYVEVSSGYKNIIGKLAGNDAKGQHKDWNNGAFAGWGAKGSTTPEMLVNKFFDMLGDNAAKIIGGQSLADPFGKPITKVYLTEDGRDLKQLIQKFLLMGVAYSQGADDYLDNNTENEGLLADNIEFTAKSGGKYTKLEHKFDEGFGYFGAARDYLDYSDNEIAGKGGEGERKSYHDSDGDGKINFHSEYNFGQSTNAAKRDRKATVATDMTKDAMESFLKGRKLISDAAGNALTEAQMTELVGYRDKALLAWEQAIAATVIHYINDTRADLEKIGTDGFDYATLAKHWSEMKGFALGLQFNRLGKITEAQFIDMHEKMGDKPATLTDTAAVSAYRDALLGARQILQDAYGFSAENVSNW